MSGSAPERPTEARVEPGPSSSSPAPSTERVEHVEGLASDEGDGALVTRAGLARLETLLAGVPLDETIGALTYAERAREDGAGERGAVAFAQTEAARTVASPREGEPSRPHEGSAPADGDADPLAGLPHLSLSRGLSRRAGADEGARHDPKLVDFELLETLGEGGMGRVHLALQRSLGREVAIKVVKSEARRADVVSALVREARTMGRLEHPHVVPVHALGRDRDGSPVLVMKRVEGVTWAALLERPEHPHWARHPPPRGDRLAVHLSILRDVARALHFAHSRGVVHRDVKPDNVLVGEYGEVYLADWGIAVELPPPGAPPREPGPLVGTPVFLAPEMISGRVEHLGPHTDVYLLGATLHFVLTGSPRHQGRSLGEVLRRASESAPFPYATDVPTELAELATRSTCRDPRERPASAHEFGLALERFERHRGALALAAAAEERLPAIAAELDAHEAAREPGRALRVQRLLAEARFACTEAQRDYPDCPLALAVLSALARHEIRFEVLEERHDTASALLSELLGPEPELVARVEALGQRLARARHAAAENARVARAHDPLGGARPRQVLFVSLGAVSLFVSWLAWAKGYSLDTRDALVISLVVNVVLAVALGLLRRALFVTLQNRLLVGLMFAWSLLSTANRGLAVRTGMPAASMFHTELFGVALVMLSAGLLGYRGFFALVPIPLVASLLLVRSPAHAFQIFSVAAAVAVLATLALVRRMAVREPSEPSEPR
jgi:hypothetical protein